MITTTRPPHNLDIQRAKCGEMSTKVKRRALNVGLHNTKQGREPHSRMPAFLVLIVAALFCAASVGALI